MCIIYMVVDQTDVVPQDIVNASLQPSLAALI